MIGVEVARIDGRASSQTGAAYDELRALILHGRLAPDERLTVDGLRQRLQFGASPIREALNRLLAEGLVVLEDQKGFRVAPVSRDDLEALLKARCWVDGAAVTESIAVHDRGWEDGLVLALHHLSRARRRRDGSPEDNLEWELLHREFHLALIAGCGSHWMTRMSEQLFDAAERYRRLGAPQVPERNELDEHREIVEACFDRQTDRAVRLITHHYRRTFDIIADTFAAQ